MVNLLLFKAWKNRPLRFKFKLNSIDYYKKKSGFLNYTTMLFVNGGTTRALLLFLLTSISSLPVALRGSKCMHRFSASFPLERNGKQ